MYMPAQIQLETVEMVEIEPESAVPVARSSTATLSCSASDVLSPVISAVTLSSPDRYDGRWSPASAQKSQIRVLGRESRKT